MDWKLSLAIQPVDGRRPTDKHSAPKLAWNFDNPAVPNNLTLLLHCKDIWYWHALMISFPARFLARQAVLWEWVRVMGHRANANGFCQFELCRSVRSASRFGQKIGLNWQFQCEWWRKLICLGHDAGHRHREFCPCKNGLKNKKASSTEATVGQHSAPGVYPH